MNPLFLCGFSRIERGIRALRISGHLARAGKCFVIVRTIPVTGPFPDISADVIQPITVGCELSDRGNSRKAILGRVAATHRETSLIDIGSELPVRHDLVAPGIELSGDASSSSELPFGFCGKSFARPFGIGYRVFISQLNDGIIVLPLDRTFRSGGVSPNAVNRFWF